jgi:D-beta-D-heptose 7-phosphate kinase/D-beta-D-heptose 1-phosphate adenosyltransferase
MPIGDDAEVALAASTMLDQYGIRAALVTRSEDGMTLVQEDRAVIHIPAETREVFDVSGAGDTVVAVLSAALALGADLADAARFANVAAGIVVGKAGTAVVHPNELRRALLDDAQHALTDKILTAVEATARIAEWRGAGLAIGFTNGCFDLLHPGHVSLLTQARGACDRLIVGLNTDASVRRLKGPDRPVQQEIARATVLSSLANVDAVVLFDDDTPLDLIARLRPDVLVKGADYTIDQVVGADLVQSFGGRVVLADLVPDQSTTKLLHRSQRGSTA